MKIPKWLVARSVLTLFVLAFIVLLIVIGGIGQFLGAFGIIFSIAAVMFLFMWSIDNLEKK